MFKKITGIILSFVLLIGMFIIPINAAGVPQLSIENKTVSADTTVDVPVKIGNSAGVYNGNFTLQYDNTKLSVESYTIGSIFNGHTSMCNTDYQSAGNLIRFTFSGAYALKGDGTLVTIKFKVKAAATGTAALQFTAYKIYNESGTTMSPVASNGSISITSNSATSPVLNIESKTATSNTTIDVPVKIGNSAGVYNGNFTLQYDNTKLSVESYTIGSIFNGHTSMCNTDYQSAGNLIRFTFSGAYALTGDGTLVTIKFRVKENVTGSAAINFNAYKIYNESGVAMAATANNGDITIESAPVVEAQAVISLSSAKAKAGDKVEVTMSLDKNPGIAGLTATLKYDTTALTLENVTNGKLFGSLSTGKNLVWDSDKNVTSTGVIATLTFTVNKDIDAGDYEVFAIVRSCSDIDGNIVEVAVNPGTITVIDFIYGDANDDDIIDIRDVVLLRKYLAEYDYDTETSSVTVGFGADANADNTIDIRDVVILRNYLANYDYDTETSTIVLGPQ